MTAPFAPASIDACAELVRQIPRLIPVGGGTKPRLAEVSSSYTRLGLSALRGIREYEPAEYTVTALAGTPLSELVTALHAQGQYLPFEPLFCAAGSTLGGAVAAGANGPGRFRFGGIRDFILGIRFIDGAGRVLRMGGKVVKNAAGFDLPKFFVGSLGRYGVLVEVTLKVFPKRPTAATVQLNPLPARETVLVLLDAAKARWELDALDVSPEGRVCMRLAAPESALPTLVEEILGRWSGRQLESLEAAALWTSFQECRWAHNRGVLTKLAVVPTDLPDLLELVAKLNDARLYLGSGGNFALLSLPASGEISKLDQALRRAGRTALTLRGPAPLWLGGRRDAAIAEAVKHALDESGRFPPLED